jgi:hypothetical protein
MNHRIHILNKKTYNPVTQQPWIDETRIFYVGRPNILGNPFHLADRTREEAVQKFRKSLHHCRDIRSAEGLELERIARIIANDPGQDWGLMCWCAPEACHADVIKRAIEYVIKKESGEHKIEPIPGYEGLGKCSVCQAAEGEIPKECPGRPMTEYEKDGVMEGELDYHDGRWWDLTNPDPEETPTIKGQKMVPGPHGEMVLAITGHRPDKLGGYDGGTYTSLVSFAKRILGELKPIKVITGMALGWDQAVAQACVELEIPFVAAIPFRGQDSRWPGESQDRYHALLNKAVEIVTVSQGGYSAQKMQVRNEWMVDHCDVLLALWDGSSGGTANCVRYAEAKKVPIINVWSDWVKKGE